MAGGGAAASHGMGLTRGYVVALLFAISLFNYLGTYHCVYLSSTIAIDAVLLLRADETARRPMERRRHY